MFDDRLYNSKSILCVAHPKSVLSFNRFGTLKAVESLDCKNALPALRAFAAFQALKAFNALKAFALRKAFKAHEAVEALKCKHILCAARVWGTGRCIQRAQPRHTRQIRP